MSNNAHHPEEFVEALDSALNVDVLCLLKAAKETDPETKLRLADVFRGLFQINGPKSQGLAALSRRTDFSLDRDLMSELGLKK